MGAGVRIASGMWLSVACALISASAAVPQVQEVDVAIVGAGYSGLAAARRLQQFNRDGAAITFHILEARDRPGGRTLNRNVATGAQSEASDDVIELGGEWLAPEHSEAIGLFRDELGFDLFHRPYNSRRLRGRRPGVDPSGAAMPPLCSGQCPIVVHTSAGTFNASTQQDVIAQLPRSAQRQIQLAEQELFRQQAKTPCSNPLSNPDAAELDGTTFAAWLRQHAPAEEAQAYMAAYADDAEALDQISTLDVAWVLNCTAVVGSSDEDYYRIRGGSQGPALQLAAALGAGRLTLSSPVTAVRRGGGGSRWEVRSARRTLLAKHVLFAGLPPALLLGIAFEPALPGAVAQMLQRVPLGDSLKYSVVYRTPWWRARGFVGKVQSFSTNRSAGMVSPYTVQCFDNSPYSWNRGVITCFSEGDRNRAFMRDLTPQQRLEHIAEYIARSFGGYPLADGSGDVLDVFALNWADEPYSRGAYSTFHPPGVLTATWQILAPIYQESRLGPDGLWISGADWYPESIGYIDGALRSGRLSIERIVRALKMEQHMPAFVMYQ